MQISRRGWTFWLAAILSMHAAAMAQEQTHVVSARTWGAAQAAAVAASGGAVVFGHPGAGVAACDRRIRDSYVFARARAA